MKEIQSCLLSKPYNTQLGEFKMVGPRAEAHKAAWKSAGITEEFCFYTSRWCMWGSHYYLHFAFKKVISPGSLNQEMMDPQARWHRIGKHVVRGQVYLYFGKSLIIPLGSSSTASYKLHPLLHLFLQKLTTLDVLKSTHKSKTKPWYIFALWVCHFCFSLHSSLFSDF